MEEVQYLDEELDGLEIEMNEKFEELKKNEKKLSPATRNDRINYIFDRINRAKDVLSNFRVELREVLKEGGREAHADYNARGQAHNAAVNKISSELEAFKNAADKRDLMKGGKKKKEKEPEGPSSNKHIEEGKVLQEKSAAALERTGFLVSQMEEIGIETNSKLRAQTEQMKNTNADVQSVDQGMQRASKVTKDIIRKLGTDKLIMCLVLVLVILIITVIVLKALGIDVAKLLTGELNCILLQATPGADLSNCTNATNISAIIGVLPGFVRPPSTAPAPPPPPSNDTTTYIETTAEFVTTPAPDASNCTNSSDGNTTVCGNISVKVTTTPAPGLRRDEYPATTPIPYPATTSIPDGVSGSDGGLGARRSLLLELLQQERQRMRGGMDGQDALHADRQQAGALGNTQKSRTEGEMGGEGTAEIANGDIAKGGVANGATMMTMMTVHENRATEEAVKTYRETGG